MVSSIEKEDLTEAKEDPEASIPPIECRKLWKIYGRGADLALDAIKSEDLSKEQVLKRFGCVIGVAEATFNVKQGEIFCIMGLSGSGKSTLIRHVNRLIEPTAGQVLIHGTDIGGLNGEQLRKLRAEKIGMVFQNMALLPYRTVRDNVAFGLEVRKVKKQERFHAADQAIKIVQLSGWEDRYPEELSGGMQQRVGLARALAAIRFLEIGKAFDAGLAIVILAIILDRISQGAINLIKKGPREK